MKSYEGTAVMVILLYASSQACDCHCLYVKYIIFKLPTIFNQAFDALLVVLFSVVSSER